MNRRLLAIIVLCCSVAPARAEVVEADLLAVGGTESGWAAAIQAARLGVESITLVNDIEWLGGQFSAEAVGAIDENRSVDNKVPFPRSGLFAEVTACIEEDSLRLYGHPKPGNSWTARTEVRPTQAVRIFREMIDPYATAIATGKNHYLRRDFELLDAADLRIIAPDPQKVGIWSGKKIADLADARYANLTLHNISGPIGTVTSAHLAASIPNSPALEWYGASVPFFDDLLKTGPLIEKGRIAMNDRPGWGVELDEEVAYRYRNRDHGFFE